MKADNYSYVQKDPATFPRCSSSPPELSADHRTFALSCEVQPGRDYEIWFNSEAYMNFKDEDGVPAVPFQLKFRTESGAEPTRP